MAAVTQCASGANAPAANVPAVPTCQRSQRGSGLNALQRAQRTAAGPTCCSWLNTVQLVAAINYGVAVNPCGGGPSLRRWQSINARLNHRGGGKSMRGAPVNKPVGVN